MKTKTKQDRPNISMSGWIVKARDLGIDLKQFKTDKLADYQRLRESGLPTWDDFQTKYTEFNPDNKNLMKFLNKHGMFVVRGVPNTSKLGRVSKRGVSCFQECSDFLQGEIKSRNKKLYSVLLTEWEPTSYGGIVISTPNKLLIEVGENLDEVEHGQVTPTTGWLNDFGMKYTTNDTELRRLMWDALKPVKNLEGYFEFVVTEKDRDIKFIDYKVCEGYLE